MDSLAISLGQMSIIILPYCIFKYKNPEPLKKMIFEKSNIKTNLILWSVEVSYMVFIYISSTSHLSRIILILNMSFKRLTFEDPT